MHRLPVRDIMQTAVITIHPTALMADAAQILDEFHIRRLPVIDEDGYLVGIVTATDIREAEAASSAVNSYEPSVGEEWLTVADIMTREVITIEPSATVGQLALTLSKHKIGGLPVVEHDEKHPARRLLVGIVSEMDIFQMIADAWQQDQSKPEHSKAEPGT